MLREHVNANASAAKMEGLGLDALKAMDAQLSANMKETRSGARQVWAEQQRKIRSQMRHSKRESRRQAAARPTDTGPIPDVSADVSIADTSRYGAVVLHQLFEPKAPTDSLTATVVESHHDDLAMLKLTRYLRAHGIDIRVLTLTDSSDRNLDDYTPEQLDPTRWIEGKRQNRLAGVSSMHRLSLPDGNLGSHRDQARRFVRDMSVGSDLFFVPSIVDAHRDHRDAADIVYDVAGNLPVYLMDTITGLDMDGRPLNPVRYAVLSFEEALMENMMYLENTSQWQNIPINEFRDVQRVLQMASVRGQQFGVDYAAVLFDPLNTKTNPLRDTVPFKEVDIVRLN